jgi:nickel-dependent lactate racemase
VPKIKVQYPPYEDLIAEISEDVLIHSIKPKKEEKISTNTQNDELIKDSLNHPLNRNSLNEFVTKKISFSKKGIKNIRVLLICDDHTRVTPVKVLLPPIFKALELNGIEKKQVILMVAGGSHRLMTQDELLAKFGSTIIDSYRILQHEWNNEKDLKHCGTTAEGVEIYVNKMLLETDIIIGLGNIVPHEIAGFSGGYKILFPGLSNLETVQKIHWLSTSIPIGARLGSSKNLIRDLINTCGLRTNLNFIINTILDLNGNIVKVLSGDPILVQEEGAKIALEVYGVNVKATEIVITDCLPEKSDLWTSSKAILHTKGFVTKGGILICCAACPEGVCPSHPQILQMGYQSPQDLEEKYLNKKDVKGNLLFNRLSATHCANIWEVQQHCKIFLVTKGITKKDAEFLGFEYFSSLQSAVDEALKRIKGIKEINLIQRGSEILNIYGVN